MGEWFKGAGGRQIRPQQDTMKQKKEEKRRAMDRTQGNDGMGGRGKCRQLAREGFVSQHRGRTIRRNALTDGFVGESGSRACDCEPDGGRAAKCRQRGGDR